MITFLELRIQKKSEKRLQKWARNSDPLLVPLSIGIFAEGSENGRILGPAFWCWRTTFELIFGTIWTRSDHFVSNMQPENSKV